MIRRIGAFVGLAFLAAAASAQDASRFEPYVGERVFSMYSNGAKTGWFRISLEAGQEYDGKKVYALTHEGCTFEGDATSVRKETKYFDAAAPHGLLGFDLVKTGSSGRTRVTGKRTELAMLMVRELALASEEFQGAYSDETLDHYLTAQLACRRGLTGNVFRERIKEYSTDAYADRDLEVVVVPVPGCFDRGIVHTLFQVEAVDVSRPDQQRIYTFLNDLGEIVEARSAMGFYMRAEPSDWATSRESSLRVVSHTYQEVEGKLPAGSSPHHVLLEVIGADGDLPEATPRQGAFLVDERHWVLTPRTLEWSENAGLATSPPGKEALAAEPEVPADDPAIRAKAAELAGPATGVQKKAARILEWIAAEIQPVRRPSVSGARTFADKAGDGPGRAALFAALARAAGVPTRRVQGLVFASGVLSYDEWAEVHDGKVWRPVDPAAGRTHVSGGHVRLGVVDPEGKVRGSRALERARFRLLPMTGAHGHVIQFKEGHVLFGKQLFAQDNRLYARTEMGEVSWPMSEIASVDAATPERLAATLRTVKDGRYRNNVLGFGVPLPAGWSDATDPRLSPERGVVLQTASPDKQALVSLTVDSSPAPVDYFADEVEASILRQGARRLDDREWVRHKDLYMQIRTYQIAGGSRGGDRAAIAVFFEKGSSKYYFLASAPKADLELLRGQLWEMVEGLQFDAR